VTPTFLLAKYHSWYRLDLSFIATRLCPAAAAVSWVEGCLQRMMMTRRVTVRQRQCELNVSPVYSLLLYVRGVVSCVVELNAMICHRLTNGLFYAAFCCSSRMGALCQAWLLNARARRGHPPSPHAHARMIACIVDVLSRVGAGSSVLRGG
jgi:hypothetical protein